MVPSKLSVHAIYYHDHYYQYFIFVYIFIQKSIKMGYEKVAFLI